MITVAELIAELSRHEGNRAVYVGTADQIALAATVEDDCFDQDVGPAVLIECSHDD